jgi:hypothetical protein
MGPITPSTSKSLSPHLNLRLVNIYLEDAYNQSHPSIVLALCHQAEVSLDNARKAARSAGNKSINEEIDAACIDLGGILKMHNYNSESRAIYKKVQRPR